MQDVDYIEGSPYIQHPHRLYEARTDTVDV